MFDFGTHKNVKIISQQVQTQLSPVEARSVFKIFKGASFAKGTRSGSPKACPPEIIDRRDPHKLGCGYGLGRSYGYRRLLYMVTVYLVSCGYIYIYGYIYGYCIYISIWNCTLSP